jgi:hypothetical protein
MDQAQAGTLDFEQWRRELAQEDRAKEDRAKRAISARLEWLLFFVFILALSIAISLIGVFIR